MAAWCGRRTAAASCWSCWPANAGAAGTDPPRDAAVASSDEYARDVADELCNLGNAEWHLVRTAAQRAYVAGMREVINTYQDQRAAAPTVAAALDVAALADAIAQRVTMNAWATVPAQLTGLLRPGAETGISLAVLALDQNCNLTLELRQEGRGLLLTFYWHGHERLATVHLQARPDLAL